MPPEPTAATRPGTAPSPAREPERNEAAPEGHEATPDPTAAAAAATSEPTATDEEQPGPGGEAAAADLEPELPPSIEAPASAPLSAQAEASGAASTAAPPARSADAVLPAPYTGETRPGFWRRIRLGRRRRAAREEARDDRLSEIETRLGAIEARISSIDQGLGLRFDRVEQRFLQFWEMEEQLSQLTEITDRLDEVRRAQKEVVEAASRTRGAMRTLSLILALAVLGLGAALGALVLAG